MERSIKIFDTTLRDGEQSPGCSMNLKEKLEVARQLDRLNVDIIEAGFAISSPGDFESVKAVAQTVKNCKVASLARCLEKDIDAAYNAVKPASSPLVHIFLSTSPLHMEYKLKMKPEAVYEQCIAMVKYTKKLLNDVEFSAEDATRTDREFLARVVEGVINAGATVVNIPDTVGYATPQEMYDLIAYLKNTVPNIDKADISVHCHNDLGMAVANSLAAVSAGANQVECTINGLGERAGNAALEEIVMAINTRKQAIGVNCNIDTKQIYRASKLVYSIIGMTPPLNKPLVGVNAFAHESGIHQHGVMANTLTYEIMSPESIGLSKNKMVLGKHSGRHAFEQRLQELGYNLSPDDINVLFEQFKVLCDKKKTVTDGDLEVLADNVLALEGAYKLDKFITFTGNNVNPTCDISLIRGGNMERETAVGDGPIEAAYNAIDKIIPIEGYVLDDFKIQSVLEGGDAIGEVTAKLKYNGRTMTGKGVSTDIIEASILAYISAVNKLVAMVES
jgi:2-isopropylmalate synthase